MKNIEKMTIIYISLIITITLLIVGLSFLLNFLGVASTDKEKTEVYECGFSPIHSARQKFNVRYYAVGLLFIIFDLEITFLYPYSVIITEISTTGFNIGIFFIIILTIGLIYEIEKGGLTFFISTTSKKPEQLNAQKKEKKIPSSEIINF
jgi:NADH:ubiquinone oxidoreductase subunit 3 (subunit A)